MNFFLPLLLSTSVTPYDALTNKQICDLVHYELEWAVTEDIITQNDADRIYWRCMRYPSFN